MFKLTTVIFISLLALVGCKSQSEATAAETSTAEAATTAPSEEGGTAPAEDDTAKTEGTKHDPPIALEKVPDGHWYCDMGTAHYSQPAEGDGKCPLCGMKLKHMDHAAMGHGEHEHHGDDHHH